MTASDVSRPYQLFEQVAQAFSSGRSSEGERLLQQVLREYPEHPLSLNETGRRKLQMGDLSGAVAVFKAAIGLDASQPSIWMNLAAALRGLKNADEEKEALTRVLAIEPQNLRALLQMASLHEMRGESRDAAAVYRRALQSVPANMELSPDLRNILRHAMGVVERSKIELENFLEDRLAPLRAAHAGERLGRFDQCLSIILQKQPIYRQQPTFMYFPNLPAIEFYDREDFPWLDRLEAATDDIRNELVNVLNDGNQNLEPYVREMPHHVFKELNNSRRWGVFYLWKAGERMVENMARCPKTTEALEAWPRCDLPGSGPTAVFSILDAKTHIPAHTGVNNARLICHLPLIVPPGCRFRVGAQTRGWEPGKAFVFDDTIEHEAWNDSDVPRAVLIFDIWNPHLSMAEREMVKTLTAGVGDFYGDLPTYV